MKNILLILISLIVVGCVDAEKEIQSEMERIENIPNREVLRKKTKKMLKESTKLTEEQKKSFLKLHNEVVEHIDEIDEKIRKLKMLVFVHLTEKDYEKEKLDELKKEIKDLNNKKFDVMVDAMSKARDILGVEFKNIHPKEGYYMR